ncbi:hypothetical protein [Cutibacterium granulosum]|uniref:Thiol reductant ABC exporter, CydC subunit n=1 Tax=Cutibacterium granulosum DSM 20700 TaxID=1160719 RepID=U1ET73_9ACTN|nr:hypothetical protein [Cutibacterium granulosum]ERF54942.1 thiol reductant ABC exporter, CydC subunit [Cutibacterium granulosum DSM 20700]
MAYGVLILDGPEHLDVGTSEALMDNLWTTARSVAKLAITHDLLALKCCN